jgi:hypothetical protein
METLKQNMIREENTNPPAKHSAGRWNGHEQALSAPEELSSGDIFAALSRSQAGRPASRRRKRRLYADYRELLALESKARKLNFLGPDGARSLAAEPQVLQVQERALHLEENGGSSETTAEGLENTLPLPRFSRAVQSGFLIVDQRMNMFFGSRKNLKSVVAANVAALVAWRMLSRARPLGAIAFNDKRIVQFRAGCSRLHTLLVLQTILNQNHSLLPNAGICSNPGMLNDALRRANKLSEGPLIFLITDASGRDQETFRLVTQISEHSDLVVILIYDPLQAKLGNTVKRQHLMISRFFPDGVPVIPINTRNDVTYQLRRSSMRSALATLAKTHHSQPNHFSFETSRP